MFVLGLFSKLVSFIKMVFESLLSVFLERAIDKTVPTKEDSPKEGINEIRKNRYQTISNKDYAHFLKIFIAVDCL